MKSTTKAYKDLSRDAILISKIFESFEAMEETLSGLRLEEPLFITKVAKNAFAQAVFKNDDKDKKDNTNYKLQ